ncbi:MAG: homoserine dehydrogenase, partial [Leptospiraceae bacterium]|nr:homoserine dehydrogenase [Leptospiraceae bacterium]
MKQLRIGLIGYGTVGQGLHKILQEEHATLQRRSGLDIQLGMIVDRSWHKKQDLIQGIASSADWHDLVLDPEIDLVVELIGGLDPAGTIIRECLQQGKSVVTANKALLAAEGNQLFELARRRGCEIGFEAAIAGALPIIKNMRRTLIANRFDAIYGILNGTCNFIITKMADENRTYAAALKEAQELGFAEADPAFDVEGHDAAQKLALLSALAFDIPILSDQVYVEGITGLDAIDLANARQLGMQIRLLAQATRNPLHMSVRPVLIPADHILASVKYEKNAIFLDASNSGPHLVMGLGAGDRPTAAAVLSDIVHIAKQGPDAGEHWIRSDWQTHPAPVFTDTESRYYLRFSTRDRPGVLAELARLLAAEQISIASMHQNEGPDPVQLYMITHSAKQSALRRALGKINQLDFVTAPGIAIQIRQQ